MMTTKGSNMRKRIAALAVAAVGVSLLVATPANAVGEQYKYSVSAGYVSSEFSQMVVEREQSASCSNTFTVLANQVLSATSTSGIEGSLTLAGTDRTFWNSFDPSGSYDDSTETTTAGTSYATSFNGIYAGGGVTLLDVAPVMLTVAPGVKAAFLNVSMKANAGAGTYTATLKVGDQSATFTCTVVATTASSKGYLALAGSVLEAGKSKRVGLDVKGGGPTDSLSLITVSGAGATLSDPTNCSSTPVSYSGGSTGPWNNLVLPASTTVGCVNGGFPTFTPSLYVNTPYSGVVTVSMFQASADGNGFSTTPYLSLTFTVPGTATQPADPVSTINSSITKAQSDLAAVTATVTALQTAVATLIASTTATLAALTANINKIMRKLKIK